MSFALVDLTRSSVVVIGSNTNAANGMEIPIIVTCLDKNSKPVPGAQVLLRAIGGITGGSYIVPDTVVLSNNSGQANFNVYSINAGNTVTLTYQGVVLGSGIISQTQTLIWSGSVVSTSSGSTSSGAFDIPPSILTIAAKNIGFNGSTWTPIATVSSGAGVVKRLWIALSGPTPSQVLFNGYFDGSNVPTIGSTVVSPVGLGNNVTCDIMFGPVWDLSTSGSYAGSTVTWTTGTSGCNRYTISGTSLGGWIRMDMPYSNGFQFNIYGTGGGGTYWVQCEYDPVPASPPPSALRLFIQPAYFSGISNNTSTHTFPEMSLINGNSTGGVVLKGLKFAVSTSTGGISYAEGKVRIYNGGPGFPVGTVQNYVTATANNLSYYNQLSGVTMIGSSSGFEDFFLNGFDWSQVQNYATDEVGTVYAGFNNSDGSKLCAYRYYNNSTYSAPANTPFVVTFTCNDQNFAVNSSITAMTVLSYYYAVPSIAGAGGIAPNDVTGLTASNITSTSITISWASSNGASTYNISYKVEGNSTGQIATTTSTNYSLTGLTPNSAYDIIVLAVNAYGSSPGTGNGCTLTNIDTLNVAPADVTNLSNNGQSSTSITVIWTPSPGATSYAVLFKLHSAGSYTTASGGTNPTTGTTFTVNGLSMGSSYDIRVIAINGVGSSPGTGSGCTLSNITVGSADYLTGIQFRIVYNSSGPLETSGLSRTLTTSGVSTTFNSVANRYIGTSPNELGYIRIASSGQTGDFTACSWWNYGITSGPGGAIMMGADTIAVTQNGNFYYNVEQYPGNSFVPELNFNASTGPPGDQFNPINNPSITVSSWYHMAYTYSISTGVANFYHNGSLFGTATNSSHSSFTFTDLWQIFNSNGQSGFGYGWQGQLDESRLYNAVLTAGEILAIYNASATYQ